VHRWWNIEEVLSDEHVDDGRRLYWAICDADNLDVVKKASSAFKSHLGLINKSAQKTFEEIEDDLQVIHQLKLTADLRRTPSTTNPIKSLNFLTEVDTRRVKTWKDSAHLQRWLATA
jgi:transposase-like protein